MGVTPTFPDLGPLHYLLDDFFKMKIARSTEYGFEPRSWQEVLAFSESTGRAREAWEREILFEMSWEYVQEFTKASSPFLKAPMERVT